MQKLRFLISLALFVIGSASAYSAVSIVPASGGSAISADTAANTATPAWTTLRPITIFEKNKGHRTSFQPGANVTLVLRLPSNFEFNTTLTPSISFTQNRDIASASALITSSNTLTVTLTITGNNAVDSLEIGATGLQVRPTSTFPLARGIIHRPAGNAGGTATIRGIKSSSNPDGAGFNVSNFGTLTEVAGTAVRLAIHVPPSLRAVEGVPFGRQPMVSVVDKYGNVIRDDNARIATVDIDTGPGSLFGTTSATAVNGIATFDGLGLTRAGTVTLRFASYGLEPVLSSAIHVDAAAEPSVATSLDFITQPSTSSQAGVVFSQQPVLKVTDQYDFIMTNDNSTFVAATRSAGIGELQGTTLQQAVNGRVTFTNLSHNIANDITILFTAGSLTTVTSPSIRILPAPVLRLAFSQSPNDAEVGLPFGTQPIVVTQDEFGNESVSGLASNVVVSVQLTSGTGLLTGLTSLDIGTDDGNGEIIFTDLAIGSAGTNKQLTASAADLESGLSSVFTVHGAPQTITFAPLPDTVFGDAPFTASATASSGLPVTFSIAAGPAVIAGDTITVIGAGTVTVRASQEGSADYDPAPHVDRTFNVSKANQAISFPALSNKVVTDGPFAVPASASSGLPVSFTVVSGAAAVSGNVVTLTGVGLVTLRASQPGDANYNPAENVEQTFTVNKADQAISFATLANKTFGDAPFGLTATASSGLPVTFTLVAGPATLEGNMVTIVGSGVVTLRASQAGNSTYNPAPPVDQSFIVQKADQLISFAALSDKVYGAAPFTVAAETSSGLPVSFAVISGPATLAGDVVTITGVGTITIRASQSGNDNYNAAPVVDRSFAVEKADQTITFEPIADKIYGDEPVALLATTSSGLAATFEVLSGPVTISSNTVSIEGVGAVTIRCLQPGDSTYNAASTDRTFNIAKAPLAVRVNDAFRLHGSANPAFTGTIEGLVYNDDITVTYTTSADTSSPMGTYPITPVFSDPNDRLKNYELTVTDGVLTVALPAPIILSEPANLKTNQGANLTFSVSAAGFQLNYQWRSNGVEITGANSATWQIDHARVNDSAVYDVIVSNGGGSITSVVCRLNVFFVPADLDENGQAEIILKNKDNRLSCWYMDGTNFQRASLLRGGKPAAPGWRVAGQNDFNGDARTDILFHHLDGRLALWLLNGQDVQQVIPVGGPRIKPGWSAVGLSDLNGDGKCDILLKHEDGRIGVRYLNGTATTGSAVLRAGKRVGPGWRIGGIRDFDGDDDGDILFHHPDGRIAVWFMQGSEFVSAAMLRKGPASTTGWRIAGVADFNRDGKTDILWRNGLNGKTRVWHMNGTTFNGASLLRSGVTGSPNWKIAGPK